MLFGAPTLRLRGDYLAIVTLGFGEIVPIVVRNWSDLTNGAAGLNGVAAPRLFGWSFGVDARPYYYVAIAMVALLIFVSIRLRDSRIGRAWMAIREDEIAAGAMGVNRTKFKLLAFAIGAAFGGMTGVFYVAKLQTATPEMFGFPVSVMILVMVVLGGIGSVWGVVLGAFILQLLQSWWLQDLSEWLHALGRLLDSDLLQHIDLVPSIELIFGLILVVMMLFRREGLIPATRPAAGADLRPAARRDQARRLHRPEARRTGRRRAHRRGGTRGEGPDGPLRRPDRAEQGRSRGADRRRGRGDRAERLRQVDAVQRDHRPGGSRRRARSASTAKRSSACRTHQILETRHRAHLPEHPPVPQPDGAGERADRPACAAAHRHDRRGLAPAGDQAEETAAREWAMEIFSIFGNRLTPRVGQVVERAVLRQPPPRRDRPRAGLAPAHPAARRADRRHEPGRDAGTCRADQEPERARA